MHRYVNLDEVISFIESVLPSSLGEKLGEALSTCPSAKVPELIYGRQFAPDQEKIFDDIEKALGFRLFTWQKTYISMGKFRCFGKTTAECIKELLETEKEPLDYSKPWKNPREHIHSEEMKRIKEKLDAAGIQTRIVFWNQIDKQEYCQSKLISDLRAIKHSIQYQICNAKGREREEGRIAAQEVGKLFDKMIYNEWMKIEKGGNENV